MRSEKDLLTFYYSPSPPRRRELDLGDEKIEARKKLTTASTTEQRIFHPTNITPPNASTNPPITHQYHSIVISLFEG